ncbi:MAG: YggS family pyridoxal phosphate-dependent enzyme [Candidatus Hydrothermales bacterium]
MNLLKKLETFTIPDRINIIREIIEKESEYPDKVKILGATKGIDIERIKIAFEHGIKIFGENRVKEAEIKIKSFKEPEWHMIGHLQSNKVKKALELFEVIESVDSFKLLEEIEKRALIIKKEIKILIEVNTSKEITKFGFEKDDLFRNFHKFFNYKNIVIRGLFTVGPYPVSEKISRKSFSELRELRDKLNREYNLNLEELSMGMSEDFVFALKEGATIIRLGRVLFGERK